MSKKSWKIFLLLVATGTILILVVCTRSPSSPDMTTATTNTRKLTRSDKKIDENGQYLPFYGYTSLSMVEHPPSFGKQIENFIRSSSLGQFYSPLPHDSYHVTIFNIYTIQYQTIPPVERWVAEEGGVIPNNSWLPEKVLHKQHVQASNLLSAVPPSFGVEKVELRTPGDYASLSVLVTALRSDFNDEIMHLREKMKTIYEHSDPGLTRFHITLAYAYKPFQISDQVSQDLNKLKDMVQEFVEFRLVNHGVYLYDSMTNFILWTDRKN